MAGKTVKVTIRGLGPKAYRRLKARSKREGRSSWRRAGLGCDSWGQWAGEQGWGPPRPAQSTHIYIIVTQG